MAEKAELRKQTPRAMPRCGKWPSPGKFDFGSGRCRMMGSDELFVESGVSSLAK
jgi:hypothetical protein